MNNYQRAEAEYLEPLYEDDPDGELDTIEGLRDKVKELEDEVLYWKLKYQMVKDDYLSLIARTKWR